MKPRLSARDEQMLSDFLDGQLSEKNSTAFEKRLLVEPLLQEAAADLRRLKAEFKKLPRYRLPRNFTLTPAMASQKQPASLRFWFPVMRFASIAAVFMLVAVYVLEFLPGGIPALRNSPAAVQTFSTGPMLDATDGGIGLVQGTPPPIIIWNLPTYGKGGEAEHPLAAGEITESNNAPAAPVEAPAAEKLMESPGEIQGLMAPPAPQTQPFAGAGGGGGLPPDTSPQILPSESAPRLSAESEIPLILGLPPADQRAVLTTPEGMQKVLPTSQPMADREEGDKLLWIKAALALIALITAAAAVLIRRKARM